jgi:hypothetical protein
VKTPSSDAGEFIEGTLSFAESLKTFSWPRYDSAAFT